MTPPPPAHGRLLSAVAAASYLGVTLYRVRAQIANGALVAMRDANQRLVGVYQHDCDAWVATHRRVRTRAGAVDAQVATLPGAGHFA